MKQTRKYKLLFGGAYLVAFVVLLVYQLLWRMDSPFSLSLILAFGCLLVLAVSSLVKGLKITSWLMRLVFYVLAGYFLLFFVYQVPIIYKVSGLVLGHLLFFQAMFNLTMVKEDTKWVKQSTLFWLIVSLSTGFSILTYYIWRGVSQPEEYYQVIAGLVVIGSSLAVQQNYWMELRYKNATQRKLLEAAGQTNSQLMASQERFKTTNHQIEAQKKELELANQQANRMASEMYLQTELLQYISSVLDLSDLLEMITDSIIGTIGVDTCFLVIYDACQDDYVYNVKSTIKPAYAEYIIRYTEEGGFSDYFDISEMILDNDVQPDNYPFLRDSSVHSLAIIPLIKDKQTYGLLVTEHHAEGMFGDSSRRFFEGIATQLTIAVDNANLYALMENLAVKDGLTDIYNRKYIQDYVKNFLENDEERCHSLTMVLFDVDRFKRVNDQYGHLFGDQVLQMIGGKMMDFAKQYGAVPARYGGEEFVFVFENMKRQDCLPMIEAFHQEIKQTELIYQRQITKKVKVDLSIGLTDYPAMAKTVEELFWRADKAMYYAKNNGRGQIIVDFPTLEMKQFK